MIPIPAIIIIALGVLICAYLIIRMWANESKTDLVGMEDTKMEALEQQPCEDCISRQEALSHKHIVYDDDGIGYSVVRVDEIMALPSVTPQAEIEKEEDILDKIKAEIIDTLYVDSLIFGELIDFRNGKISADDVIEEFNRVTRIEVLQIIDKYKAESEEEENELNRVKSS